jgi:hypothetical protein
MVLRLGKALAEESLGYLPPAEYEQLHGFEERSRLVGANV